jgi:hypothetical protein
MDMVTASFIGRLSHAVDLIEAEPAEPSAEA